jgi:hypothetical protein
MRVFWLLVAPMLCAGQAVTFNAQIAPIIYRNCADCHRPGEAAPFSLLSYQDVARKGQIIAAATAGHLMPPWKADEGSYHYRDERRLKPEDIALIQRWVKAGMPEGKASERPEPPRFASGWRLGEPDLVVELPAAFAIPADGPDIYRNFAIPLGLSEDRYITAIDMKPSARSAVHHVLYFADPSGKAHDRGPGGFSGMRPGEGESQPLGGWAVGAQPQFFPEGLALPVAKGSDLVIQYHFHPTGKPQSEKSQIGVYFAKQKPARTLVSIQLPPVYSLFSGLDIPAGKSDFIIRDSYTLPAALEAVGVGAHAHYLGKRLKLTATMPTGETKTLLSIGDWDFAWQDRYFFESFVSLPKGTRLDAEIQWDNSAENPRNPSSPPVRVEWGEQSKDEMGSLTLIAVPHDEGDLRTVRADYQGHRNSTMRQGLREDPSLALRIRDLLSQ